MPKNVVNRDHNSLKFLLIASTLTVLISFVPFGWIVVYPFRLFVTFIHEGGHALAALITFGSVERLVILPDAGGATFTRGGIQILIASAGYLTSVAYGASLLILCRDGSKAKAVLTVTAGLILVLTGFFAGGPFSWVTGIMLTIGLIWFAIGSNVPIAHFFLSFLAVQCCLNAFFDLRTLFLLSARPDFPGDATTIKALTGVAAIQSDAMTMQQLTGVPAIAWAIFWIIVSVLALLFALRIYARR